jgi:hypothetical protein
MSSCPFRIGDIVKTSYDTGPYEIVKISGPCRCAPYGWVINHRKRVTAAGARGKRWPSSNAGRSRNFSEKNIKIPLDKRLVPCYL